MSDTKKLTKLGSNKTKYYDKPDIKILETFENQHQNLYLIPFTQDRDEFTSLCPKTGQPDFAKMEIIYVPNKLCVESKSLKLYLFSFRNHGEFHEDVCNRIMKDIFQKIHPYYIRVFGDFAPRGGLSIKPMVEYRSGCDENDRKDIERMVQSWDTKK